MIPLHFRKQKTQEGQSSTCFPSSIQVSYKTKQACSDFPLKPLETSHKKLIGQMFSLYLWGRHMFIFKDHGSENYPIYYHYMISLRAVSLCGFHPLHQTEFKNTCLFCFTESSLLKPACQGKFTLNKYAGTDICGEVG